MNCVASVFHAEDEGRFLSYDFEIGKEGFDQRCSRHDETGIHLREAEDGGGNATECWVRGVDVGGKIYETKDGEDDDTAECKCLDGDR